MYYSKTLTSIMIIKEQVFGLRCLIGYTYKEIYNWSSKQGAVAIFSGIPSWLIAFVLWPFWDGGSRGGEIYFCFLEGLICKMVQLYYFFTLDPRVANVTIFVLSMNNFLSLTKYDVQVCTCTIYMPNNRALRLTHSRLGVSMKAPLSDPPFQ